MPIVSLRLPEKDWVIVPPHKIEDESEQVKGEIIGISPLELNQLRSNWCWAACTEMIVNFFRKKESLVEDLKDSTKQCILAKRFMNQPNIMPVPGVPEVDCCEDDDDEGDCNHPVPVEKIQEIYKDFGLSAEFIDVEPLTEDEKVIKIKEQVKANRPVEIYFRFGNFGHVAVVHGWFKMPDDKIGFLVKDPANDRDDGSYSLDKIISKGWKGAWINIKPIEFTITQPIQTIESTD
jgi:hypothetical protein